MTIRKCAKGIKPGMNLPQGPELKQSQWAWKNMVAALSAHCWMLWDIFRNHGEPGNWLCCRWGECELSIPGSPVLI